MELHVKNLILSLGITSALLIAACGKKEEAAAPAAEAPAPAAAPATEAPAAAPATEAPAAATQPTEKPAEQPKQ